MVAAAEDVFSQAIVSRAGETFYAFVLTTYGNWSFGGASANTIENHAKIWRAAQNTPRHDVEAYYKWFCGEWRDCEFIGDQTPFDAVSPLYSQAADAFENERTDDSDDPLRATIADALAALDARGLFGHGEQRERIMIFIDEYDSFGSDRTVLWSARRLNPASTFSRFEREFRQVMP